MTHPIDNLLSPNTKNMTMIDLLDKYLPAPIECIGRTKSFVTRVNKFRQRYENLKIKLTEQGDSKAEIHSIYEWIVTAEAGDRKSAAFLRFINSTFKNAQSKIDASLQSKLKDIITKIVTSFDTDVNLKNNPAYVNFIGELLSIDRILHFSDKFILTGIEVKMPNKKTADIQVIDIRDRSKVLIEVVSINNFDPNKLQSEDDVFACITNKFNQKLEDKTANLEEAASGTAVLINGDEVRFVIAPIIWNELESLIQWSGTLLKLENAYCNVLPLSILYARLDEGGDYSFVFTKTSEALRLKMNPDAFIRPYDE